MKNDKRAEDMREMFISGKTLQEIGDKYNVCRERVRQILKKNFNIVGINGGRYVKATPNKIETEIKKRKHKELSIQARYAKHFSCSIEQFLEINKEHWVQTNRFANKCPASAYFQQKISAKKRGIEWNITFPEWWKIWEQSGQWGNRGVHMNQYVMTRIGDIGGYSKDNIVIKTSMENIREYWDENRKHLKNKQL